LLAQLVGPQVELIDTGEAVARQVVRVLDAHQLARDGHVGMVRFYSSDVRVEPVVRRLWGEAVGLQPLPQ
jgi:glutamate racemase